MLTGSPIYAIVQAYKLTCNTKKTKLLFSCPNSLKKGGLFFPFGKTSCKQKYNRCVFSNILCHNYFYLYFKKLDYG